MKQILNVRQLPMNGHSSGSRWASIFGNGRDSINAFPYNQATIPWSAAGTFRNLKIRLTAAVGTGVTQVWTLRKNDTDQALSVTFAGSSQVEASDTSNSVTVAAGDRVTYTVTNSGGFPASVNAWIHLEFDSTNTGEQSYGICRSMSINTAGAEGINSLCFSDSYFWSTGAGQQADTIEDVVQLAGTITRLDAFNVGNALTAIEAPPAGQSIEVSLIKNDVKQNGNGGTVDTRFTITSSGASASWTGSLPVAVGDRIRVSGTPTFQTGTRQLAVSARVVAATDGQFMLAVRDHPPTGAGTTRFLTVATESSWNVSESAVETIGGPTTWYITGISALFRKAQGSILNYALDVRKNQVSTLLTWTEFASENSTVAGYVMVVGTAIPPAAETPQVAIANTDRWALRSVSFSALVGSTVFGVNTRVAATRAVAFGLDGNTNVHTTADTVKIFGNLEVTGTTTLTSDVVTSAPKTLLHSIVTTGTEIVVESFGNIVFV